MTLFTGGSEDTSAFQVCQVLIGEKPVRVSGQKSVVKIGEEKICKEKIDEEKLVRKEQ